MITAALSEIARQRLISQQIAVPGQTHPQAVVSALGAMQAQDYPGVLWAIGLRLPAATEATIEQAIAERVVVRTWPMRGTLHFVAAADVRWMLELLTPRVIAGSKHRSQRLELDATIFARCRKLFERALQGGRQLTRDAMLALLDANGISTANQRGYHILWRLSQEGTLCFGPRSGKQHTFVLLDEWVAPVKSPAREAALTELARRYFTSHGPATLADFVGWAGLKAADARAGIEGASKHLIKTVVAGKTYWLSADLPDLSPAAPSAFLLPGFDEFILGYKEREAVLEARHAQKIVPGSNGMFLATAVIDGCVVGTWKRVERKKGIIITVNAFAPLKKAEKTALATAAEHYGRFVGLPVEFQCSQV